MCNKLCNKHSCGYEQTWLPTEIINNKKYVGNYIYAYLSDECHISSTKLAGVSKKVSVFD